MYRTNLRWGDGQSFFAWSKCLLDGFENLPWSFVVARSRWLCWHSQRERKTINEVLRKII